MWDQITLQKFPCGTYKKYCAEWPARPGLVHDLAQQATSGEGMAILDSQMLMLFRLNDWFPFLSVSQPESRTSAVQSLVSSQVSQGSCTPGMGAVAKALKTKS